jgi:hypothetical protein
MCRLSYVKGSLLRLAYQFCSIFIRNNGNKRHKTVSASAHLYLFPYSCLLKGILKEEKEGTNSTRILLVPSHTETDAVCFPFHSIPSSSFDA